MKKSIVTIIPFALLFSCTVKADTFRWIGGSVNPIDWSDASKWTNLTISAGGVCPGDHDDVVFPSSAKFNVEFTITPPADFAGTISGGAYLDADGYLGGKYGLAPRLEVRPAEECAEYKLTGGFTFVANDALAAHIDASFTGAIEIPLGVTFTAAANIPDSVDFMGPGNIILTKASQLEHIAGVTGRIDARQIGSLSTADLSLLEGHEVILPDNVSLETGRMLGVTEILDDWNVPGAWGVARGRNGDVPIDGGNYIPNQTMPYVKEEGTLILTDDFQQKNVCTLTNCSFSADDTWCVKYTWKATWPEDSHKRTYEGDDFWCSWGFDFGGAVFANDPLLLPGNSDSGPMNAVCYRIYSYNEGNSAGIGLHIKGNGAGTSDTWTSMLIEKDSGFILRNKAVDVTVVCRKGILYTTFEQDGVSRTIRTSATDVITGTNKCYYGFYATTDASLWQQNEISNFRGWRISRNGGQWKDVTENYALTPEKWSMQAWTNSVSDATLVDAGDLMLGNGGYKLLPAQPNWKSLAVCRTSLPTNRRLRIDYDILWGAKADNGGEGFHFGFVDNPDYAMPNADINNHAVGTSANPADWTYMYYNNLTGMTAGEGNGSVAGEYTLGNYSNVGPKDANRAVNCTLFSDGADTLYGTMRCGENEAVSVYGTYPNAFSERFPNGMHLHFNAASTTWNCYLETVIANFRVMEWNDQAAAAARLFAPIEVASECAVTLTTGDMALDCVRLGADASLTLVPQDESASVAISGLHAEGAATVRAQSGANVALGADIVLGGDAPHGLTAVGNIAFGDSLTITIPASWQTFKPLSACLLDAKEAGSLPEAVTVKYDNGDLIGGGKVRIVGKRVMLGGLGTVLIIR